MRLGKTNLVLGGIYLAFIFLVTRTLWPQIQTYFLPNNVTVNVGEGPKVYNMHVGQIIKVVQTDGLVFLSKQPFSIANVDTGYTMSAELHTFADSTTDYMVDLRVSARNVTIELSSGSVVAVGVTADTNPTSAQIFSTADYLPLQLLYFPGLGDAFLLIYMILATWKVLTDSFDMTYWGLAGFMGWVIPQMFLQNIPNEQYYLWGIVTIVSVLLTYWVSRKLKLFDSMRMQYTTS